MRINAPLIRMPFVAVVLGYCIATSPAVANETEERPPASLPTTTLITSFGDRIPGTWLDSEVHDSISWQVEGFVDPLQFDIQNLIAAKVHHATQIPPVTGSYRCELTNGDVLQGTPLAINETELILDVPIAGQIRIDRSHLRKLAPWRGAGQAIKSTPSSLKDWHGDHPSWQEAAGRITATTDNTELSTNLRLGNKSQMSLHVSWENQPDFRIDFGSSAKWDWGLRLETWQDQLVLVAESPIAADIILIKKLNNKADEIALSIFVDTREQKILVTSETGNQLGEFAWEGGYKSKFRIRARNKGLHFHSAVVTPWDGSSPVPLDASKFRVYSKDGKARDATITSWNAEADEWTFAMVSSDTENAPSEQTITSEQLDSITFGNAAEAVQGSVQAISRNGMKLSGELLKFSDHVIWLNSENLKDPVALPLSNLRGLIFLKSTEAKTKQSNDFPRLVINDTSIRGQLIDGQSDQQASALIWKPAASKNASAIANHASGSIIYHDDPPPKVLPDTVKRPRDNGVAQGIFRFFSANSKNKPAKNYSSKSLRGPTLHLRSGDSIPCQPKRIDSEGLTFSSPATDATYAPHEMIKALVLAGKYKPARVTQQQRDRILTLPRIQQEYPPTHLFLSTDGDLLRTRLISMDDENINTEIRLNPIMVPRSNIAAIAWLHKDELEENEDEATDDPDQIFRVQAIQSDGIRLTIQPQKFSDGTLHGTSKVFGNCHVDVSQVDKLLFGREIDQAIKQQSHQLLTLIPAIVPRFVTATPADSADAGKVAALVGMEAPPIKLKRLDGSQFNLADQKGKILVLDFWASWCGPCVQWMPQLDEVVSNYSDKNVELISINLMEDKEVVEQAFERMNVHPITLLDIDGVVAEAYQATAIPQTVVIDQNGIIDRLFIGGSPQIKQPLIEALDELTSVPDAE